MADSELSDAFTQWFSAATYHISNTSYMINAYATTDTVARKEKTAVEANIELYRVFCTRSTATILYALCGSGEG